MENVQKCSFIKPVIIALIITASAAFLIDRYILYPVYIPTESMEPVISEDTQLLAERIYNTENVKRGDIIIFYSDELETKLIKRLIGLPGDHIEINEGAVFINGEKLDEDYLPENTETLSYDRKVFDVPYGKYFFLGDNREVSKDSRKWNDPYIDETDLKGKAVLKIYPFKELGSL